VTPRRQDHRPDQDWKNYQIAVASVFRSLGWTASVDAKVAGVRATHIVDVFVEAEVLGHRRRPIVECKFRARPVPKADVLTLLQVMADVGADHGYLVSESGFQPGAVAASDMTNLTLCSITDLRERVTAAQVERAAFTSHHRIHCDAREIEDLGNGDAEVVLELHTDDGHELIPDQVILVVRGRGETWRIPMADVPHSRPSTSLTFSFPWDMFRLGLIEPGEHIVAGVTTVAIELVGEPFSASWITNDGIVSCGPFSLPSFK
jgi:hypothetical protein